MHRCHKRVWPLAPLGGKGLWLVSDLLFGSLESQVLDFSDDVDADLLYTSDFTIPLPIGFFPETVSGLELGFLTFLARLAISSSYGT